MDRNTVTGFILIFLILMVWQYTSAPTPAELAEIKTRDSLERVRIVVDSLAQTKQSQDLETNNEIAVELPDSVKMAQASGKFGLFAAASIGTEQTFKLSNDLVEITFSNKGGIIKDVLLKKYHKLELDSLGNETKIPLRLLEDQKNKFEYLLPMNGTGTIKSSDLFFEGVQSGNTITFTAKANNGKTFQQKYSLKDNSYACDYSLNFNGLESDMNAQNVTLNWVNWLDKLELNEQYERNYSTVYYKEAEEDPTYCSCTSDDEENIAEKVKWVSNSNQFFNSTLMAESAFSSADLTTQILDEKESDLKKITSSIKIPVNTGGVQMSFYNGPNEFDRLSKFGSSLEDVVPFGWSIFGTINRWIIRPLFNFLSGFIGSKGVVILVLTFIVKLVLYPFTYKMIHSQSKMAILKPEIAKLKDKYKDDAQQVQVETMKMYREYGVNPLGGCLPVVLQMPIWFALYRFFPGSIEFRQEPFLWASDLSSYDVFAMLPFEIPFYGQHVSLFTLLWVVTTLIYTWYNSKLVDYSAQPAMKYMQFAMPVMFIFFFNNFASGLTAYLCMSNLFNIGQTLVTKEYVINKDKLRDQLEGNKKKPKKKGAFQQRLEDAMKEQQKAQAQKKKKKK